MARKRDYRAEYARRVALAKQRGFKNYYDQRRKIEKGETRAIQPSRLRRRSVIEVQTKAFDIFGTQWADSIDIRETRIDMAQKWSDWYSRHWSTKFDAERARQDPKYLDVYMQAFVLVVTDGPKSHHFGWDEYQREWFVDYMKYYEAEEYDDHYTNS